MGRDTELITLIKSGSPEGVKKYLSKLKKSGSAKKMATINSQNEEGLSALHLCAMQNQLDLLNELLDLKAAVNLKDTRGLTPLHYAAFRGNLEVAIALLEFQANPCSTANSGETPLHVAAQYGHSNVMSLLVDYQANPLISNNTAQTPLDIACFIGHSKAVRVLLDTGCFPVKHGQTASLVQSPMHLCAKQGHTEIMKMLMEAGFSIDDMGPNGTSLHEAALYGRVDVVKLLVQLGCDQNLRNSQSQTAIDLVHKFTNPRAYTSRQILQALSQARPVAIPRPPSMTQSSGTLNYPPSPSHSISSLPDYARIPEANGGCQETPVRALNLDGIQPEPDTELVMSPVPAYNEYESASDASNFASMIAQAAVLRKNTLTSSRKTSNTLPLHRHSPSDPVDRLACIKSTKRESFSNSSTDTSFSTTSNSGFSTGYLGVSTPDRYQSPSPANLPQHSQQYRPAYHQDYHSNGTYDVPDEYSGGHSVSMATNMSLGYDLYDTPSPEAKLVDLHHTETTFQGERSNVPSVSRPPRQRPSETRRTQVEPSVVMKKLSSLPAGFNDVAAPAMPVYDNRSIMQENEAAFQPVAMETVPPRPLSKPRFAPKSAVPAPAEKEHLSELQKKLTLRKIASETGNLPPGATPQLPPPPPTTSPPSLALSHSDDAPMPPKKPPRETHATPPSPEPRAYSPEGDSMFLEALKLKKGSLKRAQTLQVISPPPQVSDEPIRPVNPPRPISGTQEHNDTQNTPTFKHSSSTLGRLKRYETDIAIGTNTPVPPDSPPHQGQRARVGTLLSKVSTTDSWPLDRFLSALKLSDYLSVLSEAGYAESADLVGISADDVTEAGVSKAGHKKKFLASIQSLSAKHAGYDHIPTSIETWLSQWNLSSYQDTLIDSGYDDLEFIADMTSEDLRELGIEKRPILNRFSLALSHLHTCIVTHRSIVLSSSPHVTPKKPSVPAQQPEKAMARSNLKPTQPTNSVTPRKPSADSTSRMSQHEDTLTPTKWTPPTPPEPTSQLLRKTSEPSVAKKPGIPPPVSRKPGLEKRNSKPLTSPDQLPDFPSPPRLPNERKEFPSPPRLSDVKKEFPSPSKLPDVKKEFPSPPRLPDVKKEFPSPPRLPDVKKEFPSPPSAQSISDDFPPPPPSVQSSVIFSDFHEDLPPPPLEMSFPLDEIPPPPPPDTYREFLSRDDRQNRMSGIADLDDVLSSMSSEGVSSPLRPYPPKVTQDRPIQSSDVLSDIDQMLANLNLEIDSFMTDS